MANKSFFRSFLILSLICFAASTVLFAEREVDYDRYQSDLKYPDASNPKSAVRQDRLIFFSRILEQPFRPIGYMLGSAGEWFERSHAENKLIWFFDEAHSHGIYPHIKIPSEGYFVFGPAVRVQLDKLFNVEQQFVTANVHAGWTPNMHYEGSTADLGADYQIEAPTMPVYQKSLVRYFRSSSESFYGIGQKTSRGDHSSYEPEELWAEGKIGYHITDDSNATSAFAYQHMNIGNGSRGGMGKIKEHFAASAIPGINGGDLIGIVNKLTHDNRDHKTDPKKGGYQEAEFSWFHDVDGNDFNYIKMSTSFAQFIPIASDRRTLAVHFIAEKNKNLAGGQIPFFNLARLGGSDISDGSELLRGYGFNRFFDEGLWVANIEYRYSIYEYANTGADAVGLFDMGQVFEEVHNIGFKDLKLNAGAGMNLKYRRRTILSILLARGNEGWNLSAHMKAPF